MLVVSDSMGKELWRRSFPEHLDHYSDPAEAVWIGDLDGDTRTDVVFNKLFTVEGINRSDLVCYSATGERKWTYTPGRKVTAPHQRHLSPDYHVFRFRVAPLDRRYPMNILTVSLHNTHFPTQVGLLSPDGNLIREYWHSGYITHIRLGDLDRNGRDEVYLGGVNNGSQCATVVVLDPEAMGGASVEENPDFGIEGFGPGREIARLLFPRSCINTNAKMPQSRNSVRQLRTSADRLFVDTMETREDGGATLNYTFDPAFRALEVLPADDFMRTHMALRAAGVLDHDFDKGELGPLHKVRVLRPGAGVDNAPSASH